MKNNSKEQINAYNKFANEFNIAISTNETIFGWIVISMVSIIAFGGLFYLILVGLFMGFMLIALTSELAYRLFQKLIRLKQLPTYFVKPSLSRIIAIYIFLVIPIGMILLGLKGVFSGMFCTQSLLCMILSNI